MSLPGGMVLKMQRTVLRLSACLAIGGLVTIVVICFLIGFGFHSVVGKYALYTALFLQLLSLVVDRFVGCPSGSVPYTPSKKMARFRLAVTVIWLLGAFMQLFSLLLILFGMDTTALWVRILCVPGVILCPFGWAGILLASHRRRAATENMGGK